MHYQPHAYQAYASRFIEEHNESILLMQMGLGKTIASLQAASDLMYDSFDIQRTLVVAPLRVARDTWPAEIRKFDEVSYMQYSVVLGTPKERVAALQKPAGIYIISRDLVKWLVDYYEMIRQPWPFDMVIVDELSSFKNHKSQRYKALRKVRPFVKRIVGLTGTPTSNGLMDLWAQVSLIDQGKRLGRFIGRYREAFFRPGSMNPHTGIVYEYVPIAGAEEMIYKRIEDITISMKAADYLDMPSCVEVNHEVEMTDKEWNQYEAMKKDLVIDTPEGKVIDAANAAVLSGKLLQMASGAIYDEDGNVIKIHDHKLDMLEDLIEQANGQSVLVAYWFRHDHERIVERLLKVGYTPRDLKTSEDIADWNDGKIQVGLISPQSAGHGLNLQQGGHILIWFSQVWSLELNQQTNGRLWRQGQKEVVTIHHIVCKNTVDEDVIDALESKNTTQQNLIAAVKARIQ